MVAPAFFLIFVGGNVQPELGFRTSYVGAQEAGARNDLHS